MDKIDSMIRRQVIDAGVWKNGHVALNSGRHSYVKLNMEQLLTPRNHRRLTAVLHSLAVAIRATEYDGMVPIPNGALSLMQAADASNHLPRLIPAMKLDKRTFAFVHPASKPLLQRAERVAVVDDVLTTGGTPLAMAETIRDYNPNATLDLYAIWRRDTLVPAVAKTFAHQFFLIEEDIPSWPAEDCSCSV